MPETRAKARDERLRVLLGLQAPDEEDEPGMLGDAERLAHVPSLPVALGGGRSTEDAGVVPRRQEGELVGLGRMALAVEANAGLVDDPDPVHRADREILDAVVGPR